MKRFGKSLLLVTVVAVLAASPVAGVRVFEEGRDMKLVFSVNNVGYIDVCGCKSKKVRQGSVSRRASLLKQLRVLGDDLLVIDGGNTLFNPHEDRKAKPHERPQLVEKAKVLVESYNRMGYAAMTVGYAEFCLGFDVLKELEAMAKFPFLSANLVSKAEGGKLMFPPTAEVDVNGIKVGLLGLTLVTIPDAYMDKDAPGLELRALDAIESAKKYVPELRQRCDLVVVMSQNDLDYNKRLVREVPGIDVLIDPFIKLGSYTKWIRKEEELKVQVKDSHFVRTDAQGAKVGTMALQVFTKGSPLIDQDVAEVAEGRSHFKFERVSIEPHFLDDPDIAALMREFKKGTKFVNVEALPELTQKEKYLTESTCQPCHVEQHDWWKKTKHADAFASLVETDDQWRQDCIACHVLGYGQAFILPADAEPYKNVQCESCHGLNPKHITDPVKHRWGRINEDRCLVCHNEDQTRKPFNFPAARRQVACPKMER